MTYTQAVSNKIHDEYDMWADEMWDTRLDDGGWTSRDQFADACDFAVWNRVKSGCLAEEMRFPTDSQIEAGTAADISDAAFLAIYFEVTKVTNPDFVRA